SFLPEFVIIGMILQLLPKQVVFIKMIQFFYGRVFEKISVLVLARNFRKMIIRLIGGSCLLPKKSGGHKVTQQIGPVVVKIVKKEIADRSLRGNSFQCRMIGEQGIGGIKTGVRYAPDAHFSIVVGHMFNQPVDGIIGVAGLIGLGAGLMGNVRAHIVIFSFAQPASADIL